MKCLSKIKAKARSTKAKAKNLTPKVKAKDQHP